MSIADKLYRLAQAVRWAPPARDEFPRNRQTRAILFEQTTGDKEGTRSKPLPGSYKIKKSIERLFSNRVIKISFSSQYHDYLSGIVELEDATEEDAAPQRFSQYCPHPKMVESTYISKID